MEEYFTPYQSSHSKSPSIGSISIHDQPQQKHLIRLEAVSETTFAPFSAPNKALIRLVVDEYESNTIVTTSKKQGQWLSAWYYNDGDILYIRKLYALFDYSEAAHCQ
jgi:hypothetical protein